MTNPMEMINGEMVEMSDADYAAFQAMQAQAATDLAAAQTKSAISSALAESDKTMLRIQEAISLGLTTPTTADVVAWVTYRRALRSGILPVKPPYPANT